MFLPIAEQAIALVESIARFFVVVLVDALFDATFVKLSWKPLPVALTGHCISIAQVKIEVAVFVSANVPFSGCWN